MAGQRDLKMVDPDNVTHAKRERKQKLASLAPTYQVDKEDTDEEFRPTGDDEEGISNGASDEEDEEEDSPQPSRGRIKSRGATGRLQARQKQAHDRSPDTATTTSTPPGSNHGVDPGSRHVGQSDATDDVDDPTFATGSLSQEHPTQRDGVHTGQESALPLTQLEGVVFSEAQLPSPVVPQHVGADGASQQEEDDTLDAPQRQPPQTPKRTPGRASSQKSPGLAPRLPKLTREQLVPEGAAAQKPPGTPLKAAYNAANTNASPQGVTRAAAQQQAAEPSAPSPGRPLTRSGASTATKSAEKVTQRFRSKARDQASTVHKSAAGPATGSPEQGVTQQEAEQHSSERTAGMDDLTDSQLRHIAHPAAKPAQAAKTRSPAQPQRFQACIPVAESEDEEPAAPDAVGSNPSGVDTDPGVVDAQAAGGAHTQPTSETQNSERDTVTAQNFVANVAARVEKQRLWLRYRGGLVRVVAAAVVDVMRVPAGGRVYRHRGAPVLLMCSDAETTAQFAASLVHGCLDREGAFILLHSEEDGSSSGGKLKQQQPQGEVQEDHKHVVPVIMLQACEPGVAQPGDSLVLNVEERLQQGGAHAADSFANLRWIDDDDDSERQGRMCRDALLPWGAGQGLQLGAGAAGPSTSRGVLQEVQPARFGRMKHSDTDAVPVRNTDTPDQQGPKQSGSVMWGSPTKPILQHCLSREPSEPVLQAPPAARANMHDKAGSQQQGRAGGKRVRQQGGSPLGALKSGAGQAPSPTPEKKRSKSDMEAIFSRYPNLAELKKPEYADKLEALTEMWYGSAAMREYGQMAWFILAYHVTGFPIEVFRYEEPLSELGNVM